VKLWFWILWSFDAAIAAVALYFFLSLGAHGRVGSFNILPWLALLAALAAVIGGSAWFRSAGQHAVAIVLLLLLAIPGALFVLCFLPLLISIPIFTEPETRRLARALLQLARSKIVSKPGRSTQLPGRLRSIVPTFQKFERFVVTFPLEIMCQSRIDWLRKRRLQLFDLFRNLAQPRHVRVCIPSAFFVANDRETLAQSVSKLGNRVGFGGLETAAP
jgi:hypothetical protein